MDRLADDAEKIVLRVVLQVVDVKEHTLQKGSFISGKFSTKALSKKKLLLIQDLKFSATL